MVLALVLLWVVGAVVLMIISRLGLGLAVDGFGAAFIASAVITIVAGVINWLLRTDRYPASATPTGSGRLSAWW